MEIAKNKIAEAMISVFLLLTIAVALVALPVANAHDPPWTIPTYAYVACAPNTVGVGEYTLIVMWLDKPCPTAGGAGGDRWRGFKLDITKPDGSKETIPYTGETSQVGAAWITYTPDQVGDYSIVFSWPGQTLVNGTNPQVRGIMYTGDYFEPATSNPVTLHVQQEPIQEWVEPPLPADYWTRPIPTANRDWAQLTSNWLLGSWLVDNFQRWGTAPNTPHVLYAKEIIAGGISDEIYGGVQPVATDYRSFFSSPIILNGRIYYNDNAGTFPAYGYTCVDLRTGETVWHKNGTDNGLNNPYVLNSGGYGVPPLAEDFVQLNFGQLFHYHSVNGEGTESYLWMTQGSTWYMLDANTGNWIMSLKNVPGGTAVTDQDGSLLRYSYNSRTGNFLAWNTSQSISPGGPVGSSQQMWRPRTGAVIDALNDTSWTEYGPGINTADADWGVEDVQPRSGYTMNVTGPTGLPTSMTVLQDENRVPKLIFLSWFSGTPRWGSDEQRFEVAVVRIDEHVAPYSPMPGKTNTQNNNLGFDVTLLWHKNYTYPLGGNLTWNVVAQSYEDGVFVIRAKETRQLWGYSLTDGSLLWGPSEPQDDWNMYGISGDVAYGNLYTTGYAGKLYCYDIKTGQLKWTYNATEIGHESPYGDYPLSVAAIADGKVFLYSTEHSPTQPLWRGSYLRCVNATDGTEIWKMLDFVSGYAIADGCIVAGNQYDQRMYVYGKGPSATTVTAPDTAVSLGSSVVIRGTVTDQSPGAVGTPAIADADMEAWMEYLYMQQAMPTAAKGVEVTLDTVDPNGNFVHIGTVTSDASGLFSYMFTPEIPGKYTVIATFAGSESYGSSYAETAIGVTEAPATTGPTETTVQESPMLTYVLAAVIALIIIVIAIGVLMLRRK